MRQGLKGTFAAMALVCFMGASTMPQPLAGPPEFVMPALTFRIKALPDNHALAIGLNHVWELDGDSRKVVGDWDLPKRFEDTGICVISDKLVAYCEESNPAFSCVIYDFRQGKVIQRVPLERGWWFQWVTASPSGKTVAWVERFDVGRAPEMRQLGRPKVTHVRTLTVANGAVASAEVALFDPYQSFSGIALAGDETTVAVGGDEGAKALHVLDMKTGKDVWNSKETGVETLAFTPDGKSLFTCNNVGEVTRWDTVESKQLSKWTLLNEDPALPTPTPYLARAVRVSPNGSLVSAAAFPDFRLVVWDIATGKIRLDLQLPKWPIESACDFAADNKSIWFSGVNEKAVHKVVLPAQK